jgi:hypothetical protein
MRSTKWIAVALGVSLWLAGCSTTQTSSRRSLSHDDEADDGRSAEVYARRRPPIADLPVPIGFELDEQRSRHSKSGPFRMVDHVYTGKGDRFAVSRFYKRYMQMSRWTLVQDVFAQGVITLSFDKGSERCSVSIESNGWGDRLRVNVFLSSTGRIVSPETAPGGARSRRRQG